MNDCLRNDILCNLVVVDIRQGKQESFPIISCIYRIEVDLSHSVYPLVLNAAKEYILYVNRKLFRENLNMTKTPFLYKTTKI